MNTYKGKVVRSWQQLPPEIIRWVATHYLLDFSARSYCPHTWETREAWPNRMVYVALRDAQELEKLMSVCPAWSAALSTHLFWHTAVAIIDPNDTLARHAIIQQPANAGSATAIVTRHSPYRHFRNITHVSCLVCRVNFPYSNHGLCSTKRYVYTPTLGPVTACREHRKDAFCALCLRQASIPENPADLDAGAMCVENEDEETWPNVETTCRSCRHEALLRRVSSDPRARTAIGGSRLESADWETRQTVDAFVEMGEGNISDVIALAQEKHWLRNHTRLAGFVSQAIAASRLETTRGQAGFESEDEFSEDEDEAELYQLTEEAAGVKHIAIDDWARHRVLDGLWVSPGDMWYIGANLPTPARAEHPAPWSLEYENDEARDAAHPLQDTMRAETPPTYALCEQVHRAFCRHLRHILMPALNNIIRRLVIECSADGVDPGVKASKMSLEEIVQELRQEETWFNGIDWTRRRLNDKKDRRDRERREREGSSGSSTKSDTTSPVLSTSTLQTTPSPPPAENKEEERLPIPISPVLESPVLVHPIPYVPVTSEGIPVSTKDALKLVWREACAPLYHCRCTICERAVMNANIAAGTIVPSQVPTVPDAMEIQLEDAPERMEEAEEEEEEELDEVIDEDDLPTKQVLVIPPAIPQKRCSEDDRRAPARGQSPPKRVRITGKYSGEGSVEMSPRRKRSSQELEDLPASAKRAKTGAEDDAGSGSSVGTSPPQTEEDLEVVPGKGVEEERRTPRSHRSRAAGVRETTAATPRRETAVADV